MTQPPFRPCLVVPAYNPGPALERTLVALGGLGLPVYVTDDGSNETTQAHLADLVQRIPALRLSRLPVNLGKGAAVLDGMRRAAADGFTHALQVDADGQHEVAAVDRFLDLARRMPHAVIAGRPRYEGTVPSARRYGRWFTHAWVWLETLSLAVDDSLCGFRVYPLAPTLALADRVKLPVRMDFDTAILVRLIWDGVPVANAEVGVSYPEDGVSHFDLWRDNLRLTRMHTRLCLGLLPRLPLLLGRRLAGRGPVAKETPSTHWSGLAERGSLLGLRFLLGTFRLLGRPGVTAMVELLVPYFFLTGRRARQASKLYLERLHAAAGPLPDLPAPPRLRDQYRHFRAFALSTVDRFLAWADAERFIKVTFPEENLLAELQARGQGAVILGAHIGNLDAMRALGTARGFRGLNALVASRNAARFISMLSRVNPKAGMNLVHVEDLGPEAALALEAKVAAGELVFILGDRTPPSQNGRVVGTTFLGHPVGMPIGPYLLASLLRCPVFLCFSPKVGDTYHLRLLPFTDRLELPRRDRQAALVGHATRFATALEEQCRLAPFQWFNFFDLWADAPEPERPHAR